MAVPVCPEMLGGLGVPRPPAEIAGGDGGDVLAGRARVVNSEGQDVTAAYVRGAKMALSVGLQSGCTGAVLKARSPSCGANAIYDGTFSHARIEGDGVLAALLRQNGFAVLTEEEDGDPIRRIPRAPIQKTNGAEEGI